MNEGKACDAVLRLLEQQSGEIRSAVSHPEPTGVGPPVEAALQSGKPELRARTHADRSLRRPDPPGEEFAQFIRPVVGTLSGQLPGPAVYSLYFPVDTRLHMKASRREQVRREFITWVRENAQRFHDQNPAQPTRDRHPHGIRSQTRAAPPRFPYEISLHREAHWASSARRHGALLVSRIAPENVEELRTARLRDALERKCPKLQRCKDDGARTVLVLEDADISLSNHVLIGEALAEVAAHRANLPDEIYLVEMAVDTWSVRRMKWGAELLLRRTSAAMALANHGQGRPPHGALPPCRPRGGYQRYALAKLLARYRIPS